MVRSYFAELVETAILFRDVVLAQILDGLGVVHPQKRALRNLEVGVQFVNYIGIRRLENAVHYVANQVLQSIQQVVKRDKRAFSFNMRVPT